MLVEVNVFVCCSFGCKLPVRHVPLGLPSEAAKDKCCPPHPHKLLHQHPQTPNTHTPWPSIRRTLVESSSSPHQRAFVCGTCTGTAQASVLLVSSWARGSERALAPSCRAPQGRDQTRPKGKKNHLFSTCGMMQVYEKLETKTWKKMHRHVCCSRKMHCPIELNALPYCTKTIHSPVREGGTIHPSMTAKSKLKI